MAPGTPEPRLRGYNLPQAPRLASGLIETNRSKHQTSYHIEMLGISVNNGRLERDRSVGIYPLEIRMNLFRIHIRPDGGTDDMVATFQYCLDNGLLGVGWRVKGLANTEDWEVYKLAANQVHGSIQQPCYIFQNVRPGDLVWTRDPFGQYYLARVIRSWEYWMSPEGQEQDIDIATSTVASSVTSSSMPFPERSFQASHVAKRSSESITVARWPIPSICGTTSAPVSWFTTWTTLTFPTYSRCLIPKKRRISFFSICRGRAGTSCLTRASAIRCASSSC